MPRSRPLRDDLPQPRPTASAHTFALRWLARRDHTVRELTSKLAAKGFSEGEIETAISRLTSHGLVDDRRAAAAHVRTASRIKGRGPRRIRLELEARGIDSGTAQEALGTLDADEVADTLRRLVLRKHPARPIPPDVRLRLFRQLLRRGFTPDAILRALK